MINCKTCNATGMTYGRSCPCCNGTKKITFERHLQFELGWVLYLSNDGESDADADTMNRRCQDIIERECAKYQILNPNLQNYDGPDCEPSEVLYHFTNQLKEKDTVVR